MKKIILFALAVIAFANTQAQTVIDTVSTGANYANQVWYSLQNDEQGSSAKNNWDLAFSTAGQGSNILINSVTGTKLWQYPNSDTTGWATLDTTGLSTWAALYNSDTTWAYGAFKQNLSSNPYDVGWGIYDPITHFVWGDSLYVIKLANGTYKKLWIQLLASGTYTFRFADLDGTNDVTTQLVKSTYTGKNFGYYSIQNGAALDREPLIANWDLLFTQYTGFIPQPYNVTGVLSNMGVTVAEASGVNVNTVTWNSYNFNTAMNEIGYNWKAYSGNWTIQDSLAYFVKDLSGNIWKIIFTGFGGGADGNHILSKEKVSSVGITETNGNSIGTLSVYPNPANGNDINIIYNLEKSVSSSTLSIYDLSGKKIHSENLNNTQGFYQHKISNQNLSAGMYIVAIEFNGKAVQQKLVIR